MKTFRLIHLACLTSVLFSDIQVTGASLDSAFVEGWFVNTVRAITDDAQILPRDLNGIAIVSGGNSGGYPDPESGIVPQATSTLGGEEITVQLVQSSFGQMTAATAGFPGAPAALHTEGFRLLTNSAPYAVFTSIVDQPAPKDGSPWDIRFPGVIDPNTGQVYGSFNWFEAANRLAELRFRAALRLNPFDVEAARALLVTIHQRVVPKTFAGHNAFVRASFGRLTGQNPTISENALLETNALAFYEMAAREVLTALGSLPDAALLDGSYPHIEPSSLTNEVKRLLDSYARAIASQAETLLKLGQLKYFTTYADPTSGIYNPQSLLNFLDRKISGLQDQLLAVNALQVLPVLKASDLGKASQLLQELMRLRSSVAEGRLAFKGALVTELGAGAAAGYTYREYSPEFVPFLWDPSEFSIYPNSFRKLLADAKTLAGRAQALDDAAADHIREQALDAFELRQALGRIQNRYALELGDLCGFIRLENGEFIPDVIYGLAAPGDREQLHSYSFSGESKGQIYVQWQNVFRAETQVKIAVQELTNILSRIDKKQQIAHDIAEGQTNIANLVLQNGDRLAALDLQEGEARANAILTESRLRAQSAVRKGIFDSVVQTGTGFATGNFLPAAETAFSTWNNAYMAFGLADTQGRLVRRMAEIQAQRTKIAAAERAAILFEQASADLLRTEEAVHSLYLDAERQRLNILMAEQSLDMQRLELANIAGRVHYLLQEYLHANQLETENPLRNPDYRLLRDLAVRDAEESFINAQERAYLAAKAAQYRINHSAQAGQVNSLLSSIMAARRGASLVQALINLEQRVDDLYAQQGPQTQVQNPVISVRHFLVQNNFVIVTNQFGEWDQSTASLETFNTNANSEAVSDADWLAFLRSHIVTNASTGERRLDFAFATSLNRPNRANPDVLGVRQNPLFNTRLINGLITYSSSLPDAFGVRINVRGQGLIFDPSQEILVDLRQEGASYIRSNPWTCDTDGSSLRVWNLSRGLSQVKASINGFAAVGSPQFHERSPANDRWVFSMSSDNGGNSFILSQLNQITDIEISFSIRGFTPDCN